MKIFGFEIRRQTDQETNEQPTFAPPYDEDGGIVVAEGGAYGTFLDLEANVRNESDLIERYRDMLKNAEVSNAVDEIVNECINLEADDNVIDIDLDQIDTINDNVKQKIRDEFQHIAGLFNVAQKGYDMFRQWYIDGRLYYHAVINVNHPERGIQQLRFIDPRTLKRVKKPIKTGNNGNSSPIAVSGTTGMLGGLSLNQKYEEYYLYKPSGFRKTTTPSTTQTALKIPADSIISCTSGLLDNSNQFVIGHLHKAIKPLNQLRILEDATVIYRISRAPERRVFYIDVGNLPKMKAEQYMRDIMAKHKNRLVYDASTGNIRDDRKFLTLLEDYWLPRREGGRGTAIETLAGGKNLGEMEDVEYFQRNLYNSLSVPVTRLAPESPFSFGRANEVTREEVKFYKFIKRLRLRFSILFINALERHLLLKKVMTWNEWKAIRNDIRFRFSSTNHFDELLENDILQQRVNVANQIMPFVGRYYSNEYVRKNVLMQTDEMIEDIDRQIAEEMSNAQYQPLDDQQPQEGGGGGPPQQVGEERETHRRTVNKDPVPGGTKKPVVVPVAPPGQTTKVSPQKGKREVNNQNG